MIVGVPEKDLNTAPCLFNRPDDIRPSIDGTIRRCIDSPTDPGRASVHWTDCIGQADCPVAASSTRVSGDVGHTFGRKGMAAVEKVEKQINALVERTSETFFSVPLDTASPCCR